jgi:hypothetical protein
MSSQDTTNKENLNTQKPIAAFNRNNHSAQAQSLPLALQSQQSFKKRFAIKREESVNFSQFFSWTKEEDVVLFKIVEQCKQESGIVDEMELNWHMVVQLFKGFFYPSLKSRCLKDIQSRYYSIMNSRTCAISQSTIINMGSNIHSIGIEHRLKNFAKFEKTWKEAKEEKQKREKRLRNSDKICLFTTFRKNKSKRNNPLLKDLKNCSNLSPRELVQHFSKLNELKQQILEKGLAQNEGF